MLLKVLLLSDQVTTVCLPSSAPADSKGVVAGWGTTSQEKSGESESKLQFAYVDMYSVEECQKKYNKLLGGRAKVFITDKMLCAGNKKADTCSGEVFQLDL